MCRANPVVIPRNHRVEEALVAAAAGDLSVMHRLLDVLRNPFEETEANESLIATLPRQEVSLTAPFAGRSDKTAET